jgi:hypothetical protein
MTMTEKEIDLLKMTGELQNKFLELEPGHPTEADDWSNAIHRLQRIIMARMARRAYPDIFGGQK